MISKIERLLRVYELQGFPYGLKHVVAPSWFLLSSENRPWWLKAHLKLFFEFSIYRVWNMLEYGVLPSSGYGVLDLVSFVVFVPTRQIFDSKGAIPTKIVVDAKVAIQEMAEYSQKLHNKTSRIRSTEASDGLAAIQDQLNNLGREIKKVNEKVYGAQKGSYGPQYLDAYSYGATRIDDSIPRKEKDLGSFSLPCYINNVCFENALDRTVKHPKGLAENVLVGIGKFILPVDFIILDMPKDVKVPLILGRLFLSTAHVKIVEFKRNITLRVGEEKVIFKSVKLTSSLIKRVYMLSLRECMEVDLEARLMGETLVLNRSLNPLYGNYIKLNDFNVPLELRRDQVDDLMPTIEEGEVVDKLMIEEVKARNDKMFSCMIGFEFIHGNLFPNLPINVMSKKFYNSVMKDKIEFRGRNELGNFANVLVFIGNFYVITDFTVVEYMDPYFDEGIGEVVVGEPFCEVTCVETKRFDGIITIHDEDDSITYQMVRSNPRFKHHTNEQCNKIPPLLKVSEHDKMNEISHPYQKLKGFYKGVLNLEPDFI
ncbi:homeodomain-like protein [Tanacetum coccineum]